MLTVITSRKYLFLAVGLGAVLQVVLLAFGLHIDLWVASVTGSCVRCYWAVVGATFTLGFAIALVAVPWAERRSRAVVAAVILLAGALFGLLRHWGLPT
jgi:hypothetical protein